MDSNVKSTAYTDKSYSAVNITVPYNFTVTATKTKSKKILDAKQSPENKF